MSMSAQMSFAVTLILFAATHLRAVDFNAGFHLDSTREQVAAQFGAPSEFWAPEPGRYVLGESEYEAAVGIWSMSDVYRRKLPQNEIEARLTFRSDSSASRLHPTWRLESVHFLIDRPVVYSEMLDGLPEARAICISGCAVYGNNSILWILPTVNDAPVTCLKLYLQRNGVVTSSGHFRATKGDDWTSPVVEAELLTVAPRDAIQPARGKQWRAVRIGTWSPKQ